MPHLNFSIPDDLNDDLADVASQTGLSKSQLATEGCRRVVAEFAEEGTVRVSAAKKKAAKKKAK